MKRVVLPFLVSFFLLLVVIAVNFFAFREMQSYNRWTEESRQSVQQFDKVSLQLRSAEIYTPSYHSSYSAELYAIYKKDADSLANSLQQLALLVNDHPAQKQIIDTVSYLLNLHLPVLLEKNIPEIIQSGEGWRVQEIERIHLLLHQGLANEEAELKNRRERLEASTQLNNLLSLLLGVLALTIVGFYFYKYFFASKKTLWLEGFMESILNTSQSAIIYYKAIRKKRKVVDFKIGYMNKAVTPLLHIDPEMIIDKRLSEIDAYVPKSDLQPLYLQVMESGKTLQTEHLYQFRGIKRWFTVVIAKLGDGLRVAFQDITRLKEYEIELKKNITALEHSNRELEEYAYAASHDLQEPLRKIRTFGGILLDSQQQHLDAKAKLQLHKMLESAERMSMLINDLLAFSSLKKSKAYTDVNLSEILANVLQDLEVMIAQKGATITFDPLPVIKAIPVQINQLFYNLLNNSLKFSREDVPPIIHIHCRLLTSQETKEKFPSSDNTLYYEFIFSDNGIGFNEEFARQIFGMFKRLHEKGRYAGSGIGLALCKKVVKNHHGQIIAKGKDGQGANIYVYLPEQPVTN